MQTFILLMPGEDLAFIKTSPEINGSITILKEEKAGTEDYFNVEIMCSDIGILFSAGELKGGLDTLNKFKEQASKMQQNISDLLNNIKP